MRTSTLQIASGPNDRYADLADRTLADLMREEDAADDRGTMSALDRITCRLHRRWIHECVSSPAHVIAVTGHQWCRACDSRACVSVDHVDGQVSVLCPRCGRTPGQAATAQIIRTCSASFAASRHSPGQLPRSA